MGDRFHKFILENDPNCILVEPIPDYFAALRNNYQKMRNTVFVNVAIDSKIEVRKIYYIPYEKILNKEITFRMEENPRLLREHWAMGLGTFHPEKNNIACPELKIHQRSVKVKTTTITNLISEYEINKYDNIIIQTDCEGHDYEILKSFPFSTIRPLIYISEIFSKTRYPESHPKYKGTGREGYIQDEGLYLKKEEKHAKEIFYKNGYNLFRNTDMIAIDSSLDK